MKKIQLSIPEPCHENWDAMSATQQGRYCNACAKEVIDFSNMSDSAVLNYFLKKKDDTICGRAYPDQLDRNITALPQKKKYWQWQYVLPAFLFFLKPAKTKAQGAMLYSASDTTQNVSVVKEKKHEGKKIIISGFVKDEEGKPVPFASVKVSGNSSGTSTDEEGKFSLPVYKNKVFLEISSLNYKTIQVLTNEKNEIVLKKNVKMMNEVVVTSYDSRRMGSVAGGMRVCRVSRTKIISDTIKSWINNFNSPIKIYPNPVIKGSMFTISMKLKQTGSYTIQVVDAAGRLLSENKITASSKLYNEPFTSGSNWSAGVYYIKVMDDKSKQVGATSLVVQ